MFNAMTYFEGASLAKMSKFLMMSYISFIKKNLFMSYI